MSGHEDFVARFLGDPGVTDPMRAAQKGMRPTLPKRFYSEAGVAAIAAGFALTLDGRAARTPGKRVLAAPRRDVAERMAAEWAGQGADIDPATMPVTRLVNSALDHVALRMAEVRADIARYAASDLVCYRAGEPEALVARQNALWNPVLDWARDVLGAQFVVAEGVGYIAQPPASLGAVAAALDAEGDPLRLAALHVATTLTGSALVALALAARALDADSAWTAAHVDEDVQMQAWGRDAEAMARRAFRRREFDAAAGVLAQADSASGGKPS